MTANPFASISIDAPLDVVWGVMLDLASYGEWNPFAYRIDGDPAVGSPILIHVRWASGKTVKSPERITVVEAPEVGDDGVRRARLAYDYEGFGSKSGLIRGRRYQTLAQREGEPTTYDTVEEFSGPLVRLAGPNRVQEGFRRHAAALKQRAEALARETA